MSNKIIKCKSCGKEIAKNAKICPGCGAKNKKPFYLKWWFILIVIIVVIGLAGGISGNKTKNNTDTSISSNNTTENSKKAENAKEKEEDSPINYDNFLSIQMGATYDDVVSIFGKGKEVSSIEAGGIKTVIYSWNGKGISNMTITIQNDIVTQKAQAGLMDMDAKITSDLYNKIQNGMTYEEVKTILGEGQLMSYGKIANIESVMYEYINKDGSNANFTFSNNSLQMKAQVGLE